jgi:hypothetical protein
MNLAQFNISKIKYALDDSRMREFVENVELINSLANRIDGFVYRVKDASGHAMNIRVYDDPSILPNLTVWRDIDCLRQFVFETLHRKFFERGHEWFDPSFGSKNVMWLIKENIIPTMEDGVDRMNHLQDNGPSLYAFDWIYASNNKL